MHQDLNNREGSQDLSTPFGRAMNVVGQLEQLLQSIATVDNIVSAQIWARQGLDLAATLHRLNAADPEVPAPRFPSESVDHAAELAIETYRAETGAPWGGGI